jgi:hypothetical protein
MNVKISLTIPFEEIPQHIEHVLKEAAEKAASIDNILRYSICCADAREAMHDIDDIRKKLASLDFLMQDCYNILSSYQDRLTGAVQQPEPEKVETYEDPR